MEREKTQVEYWRDRSETYEELEWVREEEYIKSIEELCNLKETDIVLDVGTGTGIMMEAVAPFVSHVDGIDISADMITKCKDMKKCMVMVCDARKMYLSDNTFDLVIARMSFHHIIENTQKAFDECYRVLKPGGRMVISEGIPPDEICLEIYKKIFSIKEKRIVFNEYLLQTYLFISGFKKIKFSEYVMKNCSIMNWLENSKLSLKDIIRIYNLYIQMSKDEKELYNMKTNEYDILIDAKYLNVVCYKPGERK